MIWTLKVTCVDGPYVDGECIRFIEIEETANLYDLHVAIQEAMAFDDEFPFAYFYAVNKTGKRLYVPAGVDPEEGVDTDIYEDMPLATAFDVKKKGFFYLFNFDEEWLFQIEKEKGSKKPKAGEFYPVLIEARNVGSLPMQYDNSANDFADPEEAAEYRAERLHQRELEEEGGEDEDDEENLRYPFADDAEEDDGFDDEDEEGEDSFDDDEEEDEDSFDDDDEEW